MLFKFSMLSILALACTTSWSAPTLKSVELPTKVTEAQNFIYDLGRHEGDAGGISSLSVYSNPDGLETFAILNFVMTNTESSAFEIAEAACQGKVTNACVRLVLYKSEEVRANYQFTDLNSFLAELRGWTFDSDRWFESLDTIEEFANSTLGAGYKSYSYGYDDVADVFTVILISKNKDKVLVYTGDFGS